MFIFDEPTTGLHFHDIERLLWAFNELIDQGHSVVVIEHNMEVVKCADHVIDLGPEGGDKGGEIVATGTPEKIAAGRALVHRRLSAPLLEKNGARRLRRCWNNPWQLGLPCQRLKTTPSPSSAPRNII